MKNLENFGIQELNAKELININGGAEYADYVWSGTSNPIQYAGEAVYNAGVSLYNAGVWVVNLF